MQGHLVAVHPAYDSLFDAFGPEELRGKRGESSEWASRQVRKGAKASRRLGLDTIATISGALAFPYLCPWPPLAPGVVDEAISELAMRWKPIPDVRDSEGVNVAFELHPGEDLFDGATFEMLLDRLGSHERCMINDDPSHFLLQQLDYLAFIDICHERIGAFHVKDSEFNPDGRQGVYSGCQTWVKRAARFRSLVDRQLDLVGIFSKLAQYGYDGWSVLEWECCLKSPDQGAAKGAPFIADHIIEVSEMAFGDFAGGEADKEAIRE